MMDWSMDEKECPCKGTGWAESEEAGWGADDPYEKCIVHYHGQLHPQTHTLLLDDLKLLEEEERKSILNFQIKEKRSLIQDLQKKLRFEQEAILRLELELINKTPTVRAMAAIEPTVDVDEIELPEGDFI